MAVVGIKRLHDDLGVTTAKVCVTAANSDTTCQSHKRVLWGDLKIMFDPHVEDQVWKNQQDYRVLDWKLYDSCGVHSLRKKNMHIHMLVEKRYPLTPATITDMLNRKLQADHWNKMDLTCLFTKATSDESELWHMRRGHINFKTMNKLVKVNLVRGLPSKLFENNQICVACQKGKQQRASYDYSRFSWVFFLATKDETSGILKSFITRVENLIDQRVKVIRCDNETEFKNKEMNQFCERKGIKREFSIARAPQKNRVAERKNRALIKAVRTMLADSKLPTTFWAEAVNTACYVQNTVLVTKPYNKTPYELFLGRKLALGFMNPFGCTVTIINTIDHLGKFDGKTDEGFFVRYSINSKSFRVFNSRTRIVEENLHVQFSENTHNIGGSGPNWLFDIDALTKTMNYKPVVAGNQSNGNAGTKACDDAFQRSSPNDGSKPSSDDGKKVDENLRKENEFNDQEKEDDVNNTNNVNAASTNEVNAVGAKTSIELPDDPNMPHLEDIVYSDDDEDVGTEADMNNLDAFMPVSPILTTRVHKDHPVEQII
ncbi:putative ribonuclease H-like domain-containing protein, partial [Tanacetum coccineum]